MQIKALQFSCVFRGGGPGIADHAFNVKAWGLFRAFQGRRADLSLPLFYGRRLRFGEVSSSVRSIVPGGVSIVRTGCRLHH